MTKDSNGGGAVEDIKSTPRLVQASWIMDIQGVARAQAIRRTALIPVRRPPSCRKKRSWGQGAITVDLDYCGWMVSLHRMHPSQNLVDFRG